METRYAATPHFVLRKIADESLLVPISPKLKNRDALFVLNSTSEAIFAGVRAGLGREEIVESLLKNFSEADPAQVRADVDEALARLLEIEAIHERA